MARKESITIHKILETAFNMTREEGFENVTARKVAAKAECSTQPLFRVYKNMEELWNAVYEEAIQFFQSYYHDFAKVNGTPFVDLGLAYIEFARTEKNLFKLLFVSSGEMKKEMYEIVNGADGNVVKEIAGAKQSGCSNPSDMFMKMWIFIHGAACMSLTGDYDLTKEQTKVMLEQTYRSFSN